MDVGYAPAPVASLQLVWARSRAKNQIHAVLMRQLVGRPPFADVFGVKGRSGSRGLQLAEEE